MWTTEHAWDMSSSPGLWCWPFGRPEGIIGTPHIPRSLSKYCALCGELWKGPEESCGLRVLGVPRAGRLCPAGAGRGPFVSGDILVGWRWLIRAPATWMGAHPKHPKLFVSLACGWTPHWLFFQLVPSQGWETAQQTVTREVSWGVLCPLK